MVSGLATDGPGFKAARAQEFLVSAYSARNGYLARFRGEEGEDGEKEEWHPASATQLPVQVGTLTATSPHGHWPRDNLWSMENEALS